MEAYSFDITPELIQADITLAEYAYSMRNSLPSLMNMCGYHATQAIEKSLKFALYHISPEMCERLGYTHSIDAALCKLERVQTGFISTHQDVADISDLLSLMNKSRYGDYKVTQGVACKVLHIAQELSQEIIQDPAPMTRISSNEHYSTNDHYISQAIDLIEKELHERRVVNTPNGIANPADGYLISQVKQGNKNVSVELTMLSRSKSERDRFTDDDKCTFYVSYGKVYDEYQWKTNQHGINRRISAERE